MAVPYDRGVFTLSLDFELVWGSRDLVDPLDPLIAEAMTTRNVVFGALLDMLRDCGMTATWATVGHLFLGEAHRVHGVLHPDIVPPAHKWLRRSWFEGVPEGNEAEHPAFYGRSLVQRLQAAGQEIGSHSFSHPIFGDPGCSRETADSELARCVAEAARMGIRLRSFVFPRNVAGHVDLLAHHGFTCWRSPEPSWFQSLPDPLDRLGHFATVAAASEPPTVLPYRDEHGLWVIPASASFLPIHGLRRSIPVRRRVTRCLRGLDAAKRDRRIFHLYTHPINLATHPQAMLAGMREVLTAAARLRDAGRIDILSMAEVTAAAESRAA